MLGVFSLRRAEDERPPVPVEEIERLDRGAGTQLDARRDFAAADRIRDGSGGTRHAPRRHPAGTTRWKTKVGRPSEHGIMTIPRTSRPRCPARKAKAIIERDERVVSPSYTRDYPLVIARGSGAVVEDVDGNVFLDCAAGIAVNSTGHSHPDVVKAITEQAQKFLHMSGTDFYYEPQVRLAEELAAIAPIEGGVRSFFGNSGTEATEAASSSRGMPPGGRTSSRFSAAFTAARWARCR